MKSRFKAKEQKRNKQGVFIISLDTELLWGRVRYGINRNRYEKEWFKNRKNIKKILRLFEKYNIQGTWAVVGHLFLDKCNRKHKEIIGSEKWRNQFTGNSIKTESLWYGRDIIQMLKNAKVPQEIACHGFSHTNFTELTDKEASSELKACKNIASKEKVRLNTFVFPQEKHAKYTILENSGFKCYRKKLSNMPKIRKKFIKKIVGARDLILGRPSDCCSAWEKGKLIEIEANSDIMPLNKRTIETNLPQAIFKILCKLNMRKLLAGVEKCIKKRRIYHISIHPLGFETDADIKQLEEFLKKVNRHIRNRKIVSKTMQEVCNGKN